MANIIESRVTLEDEVFEETIDTAEEPIEVVRPSSYNDLQDLPQVNGITLQGNKTSSDLGIVTQNDINSAVSAEATLRENADTALGGRIDQEITDRGNADTALGGRIDGEITNRTNADNALGTRIDNEILARQGGDNNLQSQIDAITSKSDVVDVVATYADLQAYDTQHLGNNDVIKVLDDETHDHSQTYYRWNKPNSTWTYIGSEAPYYSKSQIDTQMAQKQDKLVAGSNIQIASDGKTISATDTTYTSGTGLTLTGTEFSADTTVLATKTDIAPKLETEVVSTLPATGDEGKLYLTPKNYTTGTASGNPITISLDEDAGQITSAQLDGDTYQQSYTGVNLCDSQNMYIASGTGVTLTHESDGSITINGYNTGKYLNIRVNATALFQTNVGENITVSVIEISGEGKWSNFGIKTPANNLGVTLYKSWGQSSYTGVLQESSTGEYWCDLYCNVADVRNFVNYRVKLQAQLGSTTTSFEPYVGGVPSPNPDYPQQVQTVTGEQTIRICGLNIYDKSKDLVGYALTDNGVETALPAWHISDYIPVVGGETYTVTGMTTPGRTARTCYYDSAKNLIEAVSQQTSPYTITPPSGSAYVRLSIYNTAQIADSNTLQIELGSTAHNYEAYSGADYPINLGSIELCKLGTYQDYIYKSGSDWKVHKAIGAITVDGSEGWAYSGDNKFNANNISGMAMPINASVVSYCRTHVGVLSAASGSAFNPLVEGIPYAADVHQTATMVRFKDIRFTTTTELKSWLSQNNTTIYYVVATATDTTITDTNLISQLEAVRNATLEASNTITNTATGTNLAGDLELGYYEYDPTNRYDKWLWLDLNNNYEKLGS